MCKTPTVVIYKAYKGTNTIARSKNSPSCKHFTFECDGKLIKNISKIVYNDSSQVNIKHIHENTYTLVSLWILTFLVVLRLPYKLAIYLIRINHP